jgi:hypothetical protein
MTETFSDFDPLLKWLIIDGYGFHEGYFRPRKSFHSQIAPARLSGYALNAFTQGLGRSLWFVEGADAEQISETIGNFPAARRGDLWSGIGLACAYAGGVEAAEIERVKREAGNFLPHLAQGATFAAKTRQRAENPSENTELACRVICGCSAEEAAALTDKHLENLPPDEAVTAYGTWRRRIQREFA